MKSSTRNLETKKPFEFSIKLLLNQEVLLFVLLIVAILVNSRLSPYFLDVRNLFNTTVNFTDIGLIAFPLALIIITGDIDLSVASNLAMSTIVMGTVYMAGVNIWISVVIGLITGMVGGLINGLLIAKMKLPALVVTLGTFSLFRGIAVILTGVNTVRGFTEIAFLGQGKIGETPIPISLVIFLFFALVYGLLLHKTTFGRQVFGLGNNKITCKYSGVPVDRIKIILFVLSGFMSALAGMVMASRFGCTARNDIAFGAEFDVITAVVLGGVNILGGSGSIFGVVLGLILIGLVRLGMSLVNVPPRVQTGVIGAILVISILIPQIIRRVGSYFESKRKEEKGDIK